MRGGKKRKRNEEKSIKARDVQTQVSILLIKMIVTNSILLKQRHGTSPFGHILKHVSIQDRGVLTLGAGAIKAEARRGAASKERTAVNFILS